jgi:hypothetical protein
MILPFHSETARMRCRNNSSPSSCLMWTASSFLSISPHPLTPLFSRGGHVACTVRLSLLRLAVVLQHYILHPWSLFDNVICIDSATGEIVNKQLETIKPFDGHHQTDNIIKEVSFLILISHRFSGSGKCLIFPFTHTRKQFPSLLKDFLPAVPVL